MPTRIGYPAAPRGVPIAEVDRYTGTDTSYQTVVSWTVAAGKLGELKEVSMITDNYSKTQFRLTIAGTKQFEDITIQSPLTLPFPENKLAASAVVLLEAKSTDGTSINVDGSICGREY